MPVKRAKKFFVSQKTKRKLLKNIFSKYINNTIIVISHRRENIDLFDKVIYLEQGHLINELTRPKENVYD